VQEIVTNAIRHAHAANLWIELACSNGHLKLSARMMGAVCNRFGLATA